VLAAAGVAVNLGRLDESIALCRRAITLDPLNVHGHRYLALSSLFAGLPEQAEAAVNQALELSPLGGMTYSILGDVYLAQRRFPEALSAIKKESHEGFRLLGLSKAYHALGRKAQSTAALVQLGKFPVHAFLNAEGNAYCGNVDLAFEWLERAYAQRNAGLPQIRLRLRNLDGDSRWRPFLKKMGLGD
jgi:tetratricopeptide (TPR) repeat protein